MNKDQVKKAIDAAKEGGKRNFTQSFDLIINLKNLEIKQNPVDVFVTLHYPKGKPVKIAAFVDQILYDQAKETVDLAIKDTEFDSYKDKKKLKKLAEKYDYFVAQANLMPKVAAAFGKVLGMKGKMPNPKLGCVVPPNANLSQLKEKLGKTVRLQAKKATNLQCIIGKEDMTDEQIIDNIITVYQAVLKALPNEEQNIKNATLKLTMGKPVIL